MLVDRAVRVSDFHCTLIMAKRFHNHNISKLSFKFIFDFA